jgi:hypothetical protein
MLVDPLRRLLRIRRCAGLEANELQRAPMVGPLDGAILDPEQSTSAIVVDHPQAKYFSV